MGKFETGLGIAAFFYVLLILAFWAAVIFVALHFISKWW